MDQFPLKICRIGLKLSGVGQLDLSYSESGTGIPVLLLHEFGCGAASWEKLMPLMDPQLRCIAPDFPGSGLSDCPADVVPTPSLLIKLTARFIEKLDLDRFFLIGHGMGGEIALGLLRMPSIRRRLRGIALIACGALEQDIPSYISNIGHSSMTKPILNLIHSGFLIRMILKYAYAVHHTPDPALCSRYAEALDQPGRIETLIASARAYVRPGRLPFAPEIPLTIIAGDEDRILSYEAAERLHRAFPGSTLSYLSGCGHIPHEECPAETAAILNQFISGKEPRLPEQTVPPSRKMRLGRLFDFWHPGTLSLIAILKILSLFRWLGVHAEQHSWRKISRFFLQREYSKFAIGQFRLQLSPGAAESSGPAEQRLETRLMQYLIDRPELHETPEQSFFFRRRHGKLFCDLIVAETAPDGSIRNLTPHFDPRYPHPIKFTTEVISTVIAVYNEKRNLSDIRRPREIRIECRRRLRSLAPFRPRSRLLIRRIFDRIMSATFLFYDASLPSAADELDRIRFTPPDLTVFRHPGWGQTNIICRLAADGTEADLWWQFNHAMADGAPMQELLGDLKKAWGAAGPLYFPALNGLVTPPVFLNGRNSLFRACFFADFTPLLRLRSSLNRMCAQQMNGKASFAALLMWGMARHPYFRDRKMLLPVDCHTADGKRQLGLLITRPDRFDRGSSPLDDFCAFQAYVNRLLLEIRTGQAETSEMLSLFGMLHPFFYQFTAKIYPYALQEMLGTVGISIISGAEVFVSPQTDIQINGFLALGSALIETRDNRRAGSVCISGTREQIRMYHEALTLLIRDLPHLLERPQDFSAESGKSA
ncbi:MAG: alpha/beta hydrolase [Lentisphaerae bacterium]|nr:alpha/beta hydrolase [Lentisphaerota bacterium]